jgi:integrase
VQIGDLVLDGTQYSLRFAEKGGKSRSIPVRHDLQIMLLVYLSYLSESPSKDSPWFRSVAGRTGNLTAEIIRVIDICRMMKRRRVDSGLSTHLSPHSCRVATVTDLVESGDITGRCAIPREAQRSKDHPPLRPAAETGHTEHGGADFDLGTSEFIATKAFRFTQF